MANTEKNTLNVSGRFDLKTIVTVFAVLFGVTGISVGGYTFTKDVPTNASVNESTEKLIQELQLLRGDVRELRGLREDVRENQNSIEMLRDYQIKADSVNRVGFGVLWEQQNALLQEMMEVRSAVDTLSENPFFP